MTFRHFASLAAACTNLQQLERLFVDELRFMVDNVPQWRVNQAWSENRARIEGDGDTGEVLEDYPF